MLGRLLKRLLSRPARSHGARFGDVYALYEAGELDRAAALCSDIGDVPPADAQFLEGLIARKRGDRTRAAACMRAAIEDRPDELSFRVGLGEVLLELGRHEAALEHFEAFLAGTPADSDVHASVVRNAGACWLALGRTERARAFFEQAIKAKPGDPGLIDLLAATLYRQSKPEAAQAMLAPLIGSGRPGVRLRRALFLPAVYDSREHIAAVRSAFERELDEALDASEPPVDDPVTQIGTTAFYLAYHNANNAQLMRKLCRAVRRVYRADAEGAARRRAPGSRIRIGFVSTFFHLHSVGRVTYGLIRDLPRERFEVHVFAIAPRDDKLRAAIEHAADRFHTLPGVLDEARRAVEAAALDVLIYGDIGMHPITYFLGLWRLAPLQAVWWGHPETTGLDTIDCFFSAAGVEIANADEHYTERLVRPDAFFLPGYDKAVLEQPIGRAALGLPGDRRIYVCLQPAFKIHPDMDALFEAILERDPQAEIVLRDTDAAGGPQLKARIARTLGADAARVRFLPTLPNQHYLATIAASDVALDPLYFGGGNSSCDALAMGTPLVSLPGTHLYGRLTYGIYREMGVSECLVSGIEEYADVACRIATDREHRAALSRDLLARSEVLYDRRDITLAYADFLEEAVAARA